MCVAFFLCQPAPGSALALLIAFNRDEALARESRPCHAWEDLPGAIYGGRDCVGGGTWLCAGANGRVALLTNVRERAAGAAPPPRCSRGELPLDFVSRLSFLSTTEYVEDVHSRSSEFAGFNLVVIDLAPPADAAPQVFYVTNRGPARGGPVPVPPGVHGLSNASLDTPWPKVVRGRARFEALVAAGALREEVPWGSIFGILADEQQSDELPDTGYGEAERPLSSMFVQVRRAAGAAARATRHTAHGHCHCLVSPPMPMPPPLPFAQPVQLDGELVGTRSQTALAVRRDGRAELRERYLDPGGVWREERHAFVMSVAAAGSPVPQASP
jgi:uncharacterized protein with NRDE domain